jgi:WD40 repeat protein/class 3 adenylate cyclase/energy-coupling factor transporter ATP-binding protein EcfA2
MAAVEAGIKTFLIADVRGYTRFTHERGDEAAARLATRFADFAKEAIEAGGGSVVELRGDEVMAVFDSARQAIRAAAELQERLVEATVADPSLPLAAGIGLDAGEAVPVDGGYRGGALNLAARLCSLAGPGEVLVSPEVAHLARKVEGLDYVERGAVRLKGLEKPVEVVAVRREREEAARDLAFRRALDPAAIGALESRNPYKGLRAFAEDDSEDFFGREAMTEHLVVRLAQTRFLAVVGPSGSGKSSVVRAGLVPRLRQGALPGSERWYVVEMFPGAYPLEELEAALLRAADSAPAGLLEQLEQDERGLLRAVKRLLADDQSELMLVVDQLEEAFTLVEDEARRTQFLALLERAVTDPHARLRVVVTLRADFYDRPLLYSGFAELLRDYVEAVVPLRAEEFERAIAGPAERVGARFESGLLAELVADVADEPGALPLLQYALTELYERREGSTLTHDAYRAVGGVSGALAGRAEEIYNALGEAAQDAARQLFLRLVTLGEGAEDTRRRVERTELASMEVDQDALAEAIQEFGAWRLLSFDRDPRSGTPTIEVAHEALMREWARFRRWIDSGREQVRLHRRLAAAAREWTAADREPSYLLRGSNLAQFELLAGESTIALTELEREFVEASTAANELELARQQRQNQRLRALLAGAVALLALAVIAGVFALASRSNAQHEAQVALGRQLGAEAVIEPRIDRAMLLAHEAVNLNRSTETEGTLLATLLRSPAAIATFPFPITARPQRVAASPDGRTLAVADNQGEIRFFDTRTGRQARPPLKTVGGDFIADYSANGSVLLAASSRGQPHLILLDAHSLRPLRVLHFDRRWLNTFVAPEDVEAVSPDAKTVVFGYAIARGNLEDGSAYLDSWNAATGKRTTIPLGSNGMRAVGFIDRGRRLMVVTDTQVTTWDARTLRKLRTVPQPVPPAPFLSVGISPDGRAIGYGTTNGSVSVLNLASGRVSSGAGAHNGSVQQVVFSPDSKMMVTIGDDGRVIVWNPRTAQPIETLLGHGGRVTGAAFSRDGRTLYTTSLDGTVFEWDLGTQRRFGKSFATMSTPPQLGADAQYAPPLAISPDGSRFAVRSGDTAVGIYSTATGKEVAGIGANEEVIGLAWSSRHMLAITGVGGLNEIYKIPRRKPPHLVRALSGLRSINGQLEAVTTVAFSPDGSLVAAGDINHTSGQTPWRYGATAVWNVASGKRLWLLRTKHGAITSIAFSPDGKTIAAAREDGAVLIYDPATGRLLRALRPLGGGFFTFETVAFAPDGELATGTWAGIVQFWNPDTGAQIGHATLVAAAPVASFSFSPKGETFATAGGSDGLAKLWTTKTEQQFGATFPGDPGQWGNAQFTPDGSKLIVIYADGRGYVWPTSLPAWENHACTVAGRNFTREEWQRFVGRRSYSRVCPQFPAGP